MNILNSQEKAILSQEFIKNKNIDNIDSLNEINNKKDSIFKTSLRGKKKFIKKYEPKEKTYSTGRQIKFTKNVLSPGINNIKEFIFKNKKENDFPSPNTQLNILKFNPKNIGLSENNDEKNNDSNKKIINFKEYNNKGNNISNNNLEYKLILSTRRNSPNLKRDNSSTKSIFNFNDKNINTPIREVSSNSSSQKIFFFKFKDTSKFFSNSTKNRYTVNKYISLTKFNNVSRNNIHNIQKIKNLIKY